MQQVAWTFAAGIEGVGAAVGADAIEDQKAGAEATYYKVIVQCDQSALTDDQGNHHPVRSGMSGTASIVVGSKSVLDPLLRNDVISTLNSVKLP